MINLNIFEREDLTPIRKLLMMHLIAGSKLTEYTLTGNPISFNTNVAEPLRECLLSFLPVQSGSGDPSPENVRPITGWTGAKAWRTGKNLMDAVSDNLVSFADTSYGNFTLNNGVVTATGNALAGFVVPVKPSTKYTFSFKKTAYAILEVFAYAEKPGKINNNDTIIAYGAPDTGGNFTTPQTCNFVVCAFVSTVGQNIISNFQLELGETASEYSEYSGSSVSVTFPALGKNLLPGLESGAISQSTGQDETDSSTTRCVGYIPVEPGETYTLGTLASSGNIRFLGYDSEKNYLGNAVVRNATNATYTVGASTHFVRFQGANERFAGVDVQFEKGDTHTAYEPYTNTAYGGTLDLTTGVLTVEWWKITSTNGIYWDMREESDNLVRILANIQALGGKPPKAVEQTNCKFNYVKTTATARTEWGGIVNEYGNVAIRIPNTISTTAELTAYLQEHPLEICYELATPIVYQLTPQQIETLIGTNVLWSDTNGDMEVKYLKKG